MRTFRSILEDPASNSIDADLEGPAVAPDVEGVAKTGSACLFFEFLIGDHARMRLQCSSACSGQRYTGLRGKFGSREAVPSRCCYRGSGSQRGDCAENKKLLHGQYSEG